MFAGAAPSALFFGAGSAFAQTTTPANPAPASPASPQGTPPLPKSAGQGNTEANPSASVVAECEAKAEQQGLMGDAKGAFLTDCENTPRKK